MKSEAELKNERQKILELRNLLKIYFTGGRLRSHELVNISENIDLLKEEIGERLIQVGCTKQDLKGYIRSKPSADSQAMAAETLLHVVSCLLSDDDLRFMLEWLPKTSETAAVLEKTGNMLLARDTSNLSLYYIFKNVDSLAGIVLKMYLEKNPEMGRKQLKEGCWLQ